MGLPRDAAHRLSDAAHAAADGLGIRVTVAVVDEGGLVVLLDRADGAPPLSAQIAEAKAQGAAVWHREGEAIGEVARERAAFFDVVSELSRLPLIPGAGSLLIRGDDDEVLGAVGVSGGTPDQDRECAAAGLAAL